MNTHIWISMPSFQHYAFTGMESAEDICFVVLLPLVSLMFWITGQDSKKFNSFNNVQTPQSHDAFGSPSP